MANYIKNFSETRTAAENGRFLDIKIPMVESDDFAHLLKYNQQDVKNNNESNKFSNSSLEKSVVKGDRQDRAAILTKNAQNTQVEKNQSDFNGIQISKYESDTQPDNDLFVVEENVINEILNEDIAEITEYSLVTLDTEQAVINYPEFAINYHTAEEIDMVEDKVVINAAANDDDLLADEESDIQEKEYIEQDTTNIPLPLPVAHFQIEQDDSKTSEKFIEDQEFDNNWLLETVDDNNKFIYQDEHMAFDNPALIQLASQLVPNNISESNKEFSDDLGNSGLSDIDIIVKHDIKTLDIANVTPDNMEDVVIEKAALFNNELLKQSSNNNSEKANVNNDLVQNLVSNSASVILAHDDYDSEVKDEFLLNIENMHTKFQVKDSFDFTMINVNKNMPKEDAELLGVDFAQGNTAEFADTITNLGGEIVMDTKKDQLVVSFPERLVRNADTKPQRADQVISSLKFAVSQNKNQVKINLYPQALGAIEVSIEFARTDNGEKSIKSIKIYADNKMTLDILEKSQAELQKSLAEVVESNEASLEFDMKNNQDNKGSHLLYENSDERKKWMEKFVNDEAEIIDNNLSNEHTDLSIDNSSAMGYVRIDSVNLKV